MGRGCCRWCQQNRTRFAATRFRHFCNPIKAYRRSARRSILIPSPNLQSLHFNARLITLSQRFETTRWASGVGFACGSRWLETGIEIHPGLSQDRRRSRTSCSSVRPPARVVRCSTKGVGTPELMTYCSSAPGCGMPLPVPGHRHVQAASPINFSAMVNATPGPAPTSRAWCH